MNKLTQNEQLLQEKLNAFEYPYQDASWMQFDKALKKHRLFKSLRWVAGVTLFTAAVVTAFVTLSDKGISTQKDVQQNTENNNIIVNNQTQPVIVDDNKTTTTSNSIKTNNQSINNNTPQTNNSITEISNPNHTTDSLKTCQNNITSLPCIKKTPCPDFSISQTVGCPPFEVKFFPVEKCDSMIYSWDFGDGKISTLRSPEHTYTRAGKYQVKLMVKYYRNEDIKIKTIENAVTVYSKPRATFDLNVDNNSVQLTSQNSEKLTWIAHDTTTYEATTERTYMKNGNYAVSLIVQNTYGCTDTLTKKFEINVPLSVQMPTAFSPDGDGLNELFYPITDNPNITNYQLEVINSKNGQVIYSGKGKKVEWNGNLQSNGQPCEPGKYFWKLKIWDSFGNQEQQSGNISIK